MSDGSVSTLDYCAAAEMDVRFEFDPDKPPEIRSPTLQFHAVATGDFQCSISIVEPAACGEG